MNYTSPVIKQLQENQRMMRQMVSPISVATFATRNSLLTSISPVLENYRDSINRLTNLSPIADTYRSTVNPALESIMSMQDFAKTMNYQLVEAVKPISYLQKNFVDSIGIIGLRNQEIARGIQDSLQSAQIDMNRFATSVTSMLAAESLRIRSIDFTGLEELERIVREEPDSHSQSGTSDLEGTLTVNRPGKKLSEMTEEELGTLIKKYVTAGRFSLGAFLLFLFDEYVKEVAFVLMEIVLVFAFTFVTGQFNAEVKEEIGARIQETSTYRDTRKTITRYVGVNPTDQVGFFRKDTHMREGRSKQAALITTEKIPTNVVLTILEHRGNWLKVEINTGESCGKIGWVQESAVVKFKKIK